MPKTGTKRRSLERTQKAKRVRTSAPLLETRARTILETMVEEVADAAPAGLTLPEAPEPIVAAAAGAHDAEAAHDAGQTIDELATRELLSIVRQGASLELDGSKYSPDELALLAENVTDQAYLKISNSGGFTAKELAAIARSGPGQVIFA
jgi:hypothetical protein